MKKSPKNVLILSPGLSKGGMERQLNIFLHHFDRNRLNVTLALFRQDFAYPVPSDVEVINLHKRWKFDPAFLLRLYRLMKRGKWDVVNGKIAGVNDYVIAFSKLTGIKHIITEIQNSFPGLARDYPRMKRLLFLTGIKPVIVCNSRKAFNELNSVLPDQEVHLIRNGIDTESFRPYPRAKKPEGVFKLLFIGRIIPAKNIPLLIKAVSMLKQQHKKISLDIIGQGDQPNLKQIRNLIAEEQLEKEIRLLPVRDELTTTYNEADLFVLPSIYEGTPNVLMEAMSCGCCCAVSEGANSDGFLPDEAVFPTHDAGALADVILHFMAMDEKERQATRARNRQFVIRNCSIPEMIEKYTALMEL